MKLTAMKLAEYRPQMIVVKWIGFWEDAHKIAMLWNDAVGFEVLPDGRLIIRRGDRENGEKFSLTLEWGDFVKVHELGGHYAAVGVLPRGDVTADKWEILEEVEL